MSQLHVTVDVGTIVKLRVFWR